ncbi:hypothetical protein JCM10207_004819 [Rhodosporidiobolus poonsookiae]
MRFTLLTLAALLAPLVAASAVPPSGEAVAAAVKDQLTFAADYVEGHLGNGLDGDDDKCPDLKVNCVRKDQDGKVVGNIGKQSFCMKGDLPTDCRQCHTKKNTAECNLKYPVDCAAKCDAIGSPF